MNGAGEQPGCLSRLVAEAVPYAVLAVVLLVSVGIILTLRAASQAVPAFGWTVGTALVALFAYGALWTARIRPGFYLEHVLGPRAEPSERTTALGLGRLRRLRLTAMGFVQFALVAVVAGLVYLEFFTD